MKTTILATLLAISATTAAAQGIKSMLLANDLGNILVGESYCDLTFNQEAVSNWIDQYTDPADISFAGNINTAMNSAEEGLKEKSASAKTAFCQSVSRTAKHYGFIE